MADEQLTPQAEAALETTSPERLTELAQSSDGSIRRTVAKNPSLPTPVLLGLAREFPREVLDNPVFSLLLIENLNFVSEIQPDARNSLLMCPQVPETFIQWALKQKERETLLCLLANPSLSKKTMQKLGKQKDCQILQAFRLHVNSSLPPESVDLISRDVLSVQTPLTESNATIRNTILAGMIDSRYVRLLFAKDRHTVASHKAVSLELLDILEKDPHRSVREAAIKSKADLKDKNRDEYTEYVQLFWGERFASTKNNLAGKIRQKTGSLSELKESAKLEFHVLLEVASCPLDILVLGSKNADWLIRYQVAKHENTPICILEELADDANIFVRDIASSRVLLGLECIGMTDKKPKNDSANDYFVFDKKRSQSHRYGHFRRDEMFTVSTLPELTGQSLLELIISSRGLTRDQVVLQAGFVDSNGSPDYFSFYAECMSALSFPDSSDEILESRKIKKYLHTKYSGFSPSLNDNMNNDREIIEGYYSFLVSYNAEYENWVKVSETYYDYGGAKLERNVDFSVSVRGEFELDDLDENMSRPYASLSPNEDPYFDARNDEFLTYEGAINEFEGEIIDLLRPAYRYLNDYECGQDINSFLWFYGEHPYELFCLAKELGLKSRQRQSTSNRKVAVDTDSRDNSKISTRHLPSEELTGRRLLGKVNRLAGLSISEIALLCGYYSLNKDGSKRAKISKLYEAILSAKGFKFGGKK